MVGVHVDKLVKNLVLPEVVLKIKQPSAKQDVMRFKAHSLWSTMAASSEKRAASSAKRISVSASHVYLCGIKGVVIWRGCHLDVI